MRALPFCPSLVCGVLLLAPACGFGASALESYSPFLSSSEAPKAAVTGNAPIELHGYMVTPEGERFSIYDPAKKSAVWVKANEKGYAFVVRSHKVVNATEQVTVDYQGSTLTLALKQSKVTGAQVGQNQGFGFNGRGGVRGALPGGGGFRGGPAAAAVPTAEEAVRLQAAAAAFQQRQAQRQQAQALGQELQQIAPLDKGGAQGLQRGQRGGGQGGGGGGRRGQRTQ